jgi:hypothetical protein
MKLRNWLLTGALVLAALLALLGPLAAGETRAQMAEPAARLRFLHAVAGGPSVDVYVDGALIVPALSFGEVTPHLMVSAGEHQVALRAQGSDPAAAALVEVSVPLAADLAFTLVAQGAPEAVEAALYEDILDEIDLGLARLTAINAVPNSPALDVVTTVSAPLLQGVNYGTQFGTVNIGAGSQDLVIVPAGGAVESALAAIGEIGLDSGTLYTFVALGTLDGATAPSTLTIKTPLNTPAGGARLRVANGSPDAGRVDVYLNDVLVAPALDTGAMTVHMPLPAGDYTVSVRAAGSPAADAALASADLSLTEAGAAQTVALTGEAADGSLALQAAPDAVTGLSPGVARVAIMNAVPGASVSVSLAGDGTALASDLASSASASADVAPGREMLGVQVQGEGDPVEVAVPEIPLVGGVYYTLLVYGGGASGAPYNVSVGETVVSADLTSLPGAGEVVVAAAPTQTSEAVATEEATATDEVTVVEGVTPAEATLAPDAAAQPTQPVDTELVLEPTPAEGEATPAPAQVAPPAATQPPPVPTAFVQLDPGANLQCRQYPSATAFSLGLIPAGATLRVLGRPGEPIVPDTGEATPEPTPIIEDIPDMWLMTEWDQPEGGYITCWVNAQYLRVEFNGRLLDTLEELFELPEVPFNQPGEAVNTSVRPPTPLYNAILATVNLDPGVSLQVRRMPATNAESLDRAPAGTQLEALGYVEAPSEGLVGQPVDPNWIRVRYLKENQAATIGWVSAQYVTLSQLGRALDLSALPKLEEAEPGFYESPGVQPQIPVEQQAVVGVVTLDPGANLNLRDRPTADARVVVGIPTGATLELIGRNFDGTWVRVTYVNQGVTLEGWVAAQYLTITRGGQPYDVLQLPDVGEPPLGTTPAATPTPTEEPAQG